MFTEKLFLKSQCLVPPDIIKFESLEYGDSSLKLPRFVFWAAWVDDHYSLPRRVTRHLRKECGGFGHNRVVCT